MDIKSLPQDVRDYLRSAVSIKSICQCIMELVLNSLDAKSTAIAVRVNLLTFRIQIVDNGIGVTESNMATIGLQYMTSKCHCLEDLGKVKKFGFRGEALACISKMSKKINITSRPHNGENTYSKTYEDGKWSEVEVTKLRAGQGTTVTISEFLHNFPVRRKRVNRHFDLEDTKRNMETLAIIHPKITFSLRNDATGKVILQSKSANNVVQAIYNFYPEILVKEFMEMKVSKDKVNIAGLIYKKSHTNSKLQFVLLNKRPIVSQKIQKLLNSLLEKVCAKNEHPVYCLNISCPYAKVDLTLSPSKTTVEFKNWDVIIKCIEKGIAAILKANFLATSTAQQPSTSKEKEVSLKSQFGVSQVAGVVVGKKAKRNDISSETVISQPVDINSKHSTPLKHKSREREDDPNTQSLLTNVETKATSVHCFTVTSSIDDQDKGKSLIMDMFLKSTIAYPFNGTQNCDTLVKEKQKKPLISMTLCSKRTITRNSHFVQKRKNKKMISKCIQTSSIQKQSIINFAPTSQFINHQIKKPSYFCNDLQQNRVFSPYFTKMPDNSNFANVPSFNFQPIRSPYFANAPITDYRTSPYFKRPFQVVRKNDVDGVNSPVFGKRVPELNRVNKKRKIVKPKVNTKTWKNPYAIDNPFLQNPFRLFFEQTFESSIKIDSFWHLGATCDDHPSIPSIGPAAKRTGLFVVPKKRKRCKSPRKKRKRVPSATNEMERSVFQTFVSHLYRAESPITTFRPNLCSTKFEEINQSISGVINTDFASNHCYATYPCRSEVNPKDKTWKKKCINSLERSIKKNANNSISFNGIDKGFAKSSVANQTVFYPFVQRGTQHSKSGNKPIGTTSIFHSDPFSVPNQFTEFKLKENAFFLNKQSEKTPIFSQHFYQDFVDNNINEEEWVQKEDKLGNKIYINQRTGMTSIFSPKVSKPFTVAKRMDFVPKGYSPIVYPIKKFDKSLSPESKRAFHKALIKCHEDELSSIKWSNYLRNGIIAFDELYEERRKQFGNEIHNVSVSAFPRSMKRAWNQLQSQTFTKDIFSDIIVVGQLDNKFIVTKSKQLVILFDQHAVSERVRLESLLKDYKDGDRFKSTKCNILIENIFSNQDLTVLHSFKDHFISLGLFYTICDKGLEITEVPSCICSKFKKDEESTVKRLIIPLINEQIDSIVSTRGVSQRASAVVQSVINMEACRGAIMFGKFLSIEECRTLIRDLSMCQLPFQCAHGRPTLSPIVNLDQSAIRDYSFKLQLHKLRCQ